MENNTSITLARYEELIIAERMLGIIQRLFEAEHFPDDRSIRKMMGWKDPVEDGAVEVPDVFGTKEAGA